MFVPSGLAYYSQNAGTIGSYTPIIFTFKLMNVRYKDHDGDKILSKDSICQIVNSKSVLLILLPR